MSVIFCAILGFGMSALGSDQIFENIKAELVKKYPGARIEMGQMITWIKGAPPSAGGGIQLLSETPRGESVFSVRNPAGNDVAEGRVSYSAWMPSYVAIRRVRLGEPLSHDQFIIQQVNISSGQAYDSRGIILPSDFEILGLQARQTVLEGQFLTSTAIEKIPDVRRGDSVRVHLLSKGLMLSTMGVAEESGFINRNVRVLAGKNKRELVGKLISGGIVEVEL